MGLMVDHAEDGIQCVSQMEKAPAGTYDLILMDIQMPHMDGYKAARAIRRLSDAGKAAVPIVAMTANAFEEDRQNALAAGMNGHIAKPIDAAKVEKALTALLRPGADGKTSPAGRDSTGFPKEFSPAGGAGC